MSESHLPKPPKGKGTKPPNGLIPNPPKPPPKGVTTKLELATSLDGMVISLTCCVGTGSGIVASGIEITNDDAQIPTESNVKRNMADRFMPFIFINSYIHDSLLSGQ